jgi:hypothetical protein
MTPKITRKARKRIARVVLSVGELSDRELAAIATAEVPSHYNHLDEELLPRPNLSEKHSVAGHGHRPREAGHIHARIWVAADFDAPEPDIAKLSHEGDEP